MFITTREHRYTHSSLHWEKGLDVDVVSYAQVLKRKAPYKATHVFTDLDRLPSWRLHDAALLYRELARAGTRALNDPARFLGRYGLLRGLCRAGSNLFNAYRVEELERPSRWPVFLRLEGNHSPPVSGLIEDEEELENAIARAVDDGAPRSALLIIEYAAEPVRPGIYRKLSVFKVGARLIGYTCVHEDNWLVKYGKVGLAPAELYDEEYAFVSQNPYAAAVAPAFDLAGIDYGRVDFGIVDGKPQIYEINSNPSISLNPKPSLSERRNQSTALFRTQYIAALNAIDDVRRPEWQIRSSVLARRLRAYPERLLRVAERLRPRGQASA